MKQRTYVRSGVVEELDQRQQHWLEQVLAAVRFYYTDLYRTSTRYTQPLSLSTLMKLTKRNGHTVLSAVRILANTIEEGSSTPPLFFDRVQARRGFKRPYRIFLRSGYKSAKKSSGLTRKA